MGMQGSLGEAAGGVAVTEPRQHDRGAPDFAMGGGPCGGYCRRGETAGEGGRR